MSSSPSIRQPQPIDSATTLPPMPPAPDPPPAPPAPLDEDDEDDDEEDELLLELALWQVPGLPVVELHVWPVGQPLPPLPRQPTTQVIMVMSQMRPEVAPPQSVSAMHPQVSVAARQTAPLPAGVQFLVCWAVHSTQWNSGSQTWPPVQSGSLRHCTQS